MFEHLPAIATVIASGLAAWASVYIANRNIEQDTKRLQKDSFSDNQKLFHEELRQLREDNAQLRQRERELGLELASLQAQFKILEAEFRSKVALYESAHQDLPLPQWLKDSDGKVLRINAAYEHTFLIPNNKRREDYEGHTDFDVWPDDVAKEYQRNDNNVWISGNTWKGTETVEINGERSRWKIMKYVRYSGNIKLGIAGIAWPEPEDG